MDQQFDFYLSDGVYGRWTHYGDLILCTYDGVTVANEIVLEPRAITQLLEEVNKRAEAYAAQKEKT